MCLVLALALNLAFAAHRYFGADENLGTVEELRNEDAGPYLPKVLMR